MIETKDVAVVDKPQVKAETLNRDDDVARPEATVRYTVSNISKLKDQALSPPVYARCLPWRILVVYEPSSPVDNEPEACLGIFLQCNGKCEKTSWSCYGAVDLKLLTNKLNGEHLCRKIHHMFHSKENDWGFAHFISWKDLMNPANGFVKDDSITVEAHVEAEAPRGVSWDFSKHGEHAGMLVVVLPDSFAKSIFWTFLSDKRENISLKTVN